MFAWCRHAHAALDRSQGVSGWALVGEVRRPVRGLALAAVLVLTALAAGCGSSSKQSARQRHLGAARSTSSSRRGGRSPRTARARSGPRPAARGAADRGAAGGSGSATGDTIPLAQRGPDDEVLRRAQHVPVVPEGPRREVHRRPGLRAIRTRRRTTRRTSRALSTCAAKSNIVQALKDEQTAQDNLTPAQIKQQNKGYLKWRDCMIGRGWGIPEPKPDSKGRLFSFGAGGGGGGSVPAFTPPPGQDIVTSSDVQACAAESAEESSTRRTRAVDRVAQQEGGRRDRGPGAGASRAAASATRSGTAAARRRRRIWSSSPTCSAGRCRTR